MLEDLNGTTIIIEEGVASTPSAVGRRLGDKRESESKKSSTCYNQSQGVQFTIWVEMHFHEGEMKSD